MVERKPVSVRRQMIYSVIPILDLIASYKIQKFRLWFLVFWVIAIGIQSVHDYWVYGDWENEIDYGEPVNISNLILSIIIYAGFQILVMRHWSISWNKNLEKNNLKEPHEDFRD